MKTLEYSPTVQHPRHTQLCKYSSAKDNHADHYSELIQCIVYLAPLRHFALDVWVSMVCCVFHHHEFTTHSEAVDSSESIVFLSRNLELALPAFPELPVFEGGESLDSELASESLAVSESSVAMSTSSISCSS